MADDEVSPKLIFPARDVEAAKRKAKETQRQSLINSVWNLEMLPIEADTFAAGSGIEFNGPAHPVTMESPKWSLAQAVIWIAWRDPIRVQEQWRRLHAWSACLWRDPLIVDQLETIDKSEHMLWQALEEGKIQAFGLEGHGSKPVKIEALDWSNLVWTDDQTRLSVRWTGQRGPAYRCVEVKSANMLAVWPVPGTQVLQTAEENRQLEEAQPQERDKGGASPQYDEIDFLIGAFRIVYENKGSFESRADLTRRATDAYTAAKRLPPGKPSLEWGKENIRRLWVGLGLERRKRSK